MDFWIGVVFLLLALVFVLFLIPPMGVNGLGAMAASDALVGPRFFPYLTAGLMGMLGAALMIRNRRAGKMPTHVSFALGQLRHVLMTIALGTAYIVLLPLLGILVATPLCLAAFFVYFGVREWGMVVLFSTGITLLIFLIFHKLMNIPLPN